MKLQIRLKLKCLVGSRESSRDRTMRGTFAFGSSTPRILSHLCSTTGENFNNNRINLQVGRRSYTTPTFPTSRPKTSSFFSPIK